jgi:hypothetical protein
LDDAVEFSPDPNDRSKIIRTELKSEVLLDRNQITVVVPGGTGPPVDSMAAQSGNFLNGGNNQAALEWDGIINKEGVTHQSTLFLQLRCNSASQVLPKG